MKINLGYVQCTYRRGGAQRAHVHATKRATLASMFACYRGESRVLSGVDMCPLCASTTIYKSLCLVNLGVHVYHFRASKIRKKNIVCICKITDL